MITLETLAAAEALFAVDYTPAERTQMLDNVEGQLASVLARRTVRLTNDMPMATRFDPRLPHTVLPDPGPVRFSPADRGSIERALGVADERPLRVLAPS